MLQMYDLHFSLKLTKSAILHYYLQYIIAGDLELTVFDGYNALADVVFSVSIVRARLCNAARGSAINAIGEEFIAADSVKKKHTEMLPQLQNLTIKSKKCKSYTTNPRNWYY